MTQKSPGSPQVAALRHDLSGSADPRTQRTRRALTEALLSLVESREPISVSRLVAVAGVSRSVFYTHFADVSDLAQCALQDLLTTLGEDDLSRRFDGLSGREASQQALFALVHHAHEHRQLYRLVFSDQVSTSASFALIRAFTETVRRILPKTWAVPLDTNLDRSATFVAAALIVTLAEWIASGEKDPPETVVTELLALLPDWMR